MALSIGKCVAFGIVATKDSWYMVNPEINSNGEKIAYCGPAQSMQYLGIQAELPFQGKGVPAYKDDKVGNEWLYRPNLLKPSRYITALKLRANVAANKVSLNRVTKNNGVMCRKCKAQPETLGYILGQCVYTKSGRIKRHNDIQDFIERPVLGQRGMVITKEARLQDPHLRNLQPDLIIQYRERVFVADVTICHEDGDLLERVIGTRGAMPRDTVTCLRKLQIKDRGSLRTLTLQALRSSVELFHMFMDYNAPLRLNSSDAAD
ncbi:uncharacterized protein LOC143905679 [Temnothorax americanus]|uniref:uncharacterized protein LOC143905679 n=1 Tax=Temnothorax americanus TaxID=1964332 RepID=UPI00406900C0